eukprot:112847_1
MNKFERKTAYFLSCTLLALVDSVFSLQSTFVKLGRHPSISCPIGRQHSHLNLSDYEQLDSLNSSLRSDQSHLIESPASIFMSEDQSLAFEGLSPVANTTIFIIGMIPFLWATKEFWSRIAVG